MTQPITDDDAVAAMVRYGGSFAAALGRAWQCADAENRRRLVAAWSDLLAEYREIAELRRMATPRSGVVRTDGA